MVWWILGGFVVDLWWILGGFVVDSWWVRGGYVVDSWWCECLDLRVWLGVWLGGWLSLSFWPAPYERLLMHTRGPVAPRASTGLSPSCTHRPVPHMHTRACPPHALACTSSHLSASGPSALPPMRAITMDLMAWVWVFVWVCICIWVYLGPDVFPV